MELTVDLGPRSYPIIIDRGIAGSLPSRLKQLFPESRFGLVTNETIANFYGALIDNWTKELGGTVHIMPDGERYKTLETWGAIFDTFLGARLERSSVIIAFGGGVVGDMAGFAAATLLRGVAYVQVPTTLLAMVDSSVGGKTAVDHAAGKNLIGAFHQPRLVMIDTAFLDTLPERDYRSGAAELFKYAFIGGAETFDFVSADGRQILERRSDVLLEGIRCSVAIKAGIVARDEREAGERMLLNFGHTFAHALEKYFGFEKLQHGEAVWWGIRCACSLGHKLGTIPASAIDKYGTLLKGFLRPQLPSVPPANELIAAMLSDKKVSRGLPRFVVPSEPGHSIVRRDVPEQLVKEVLEQTVALR